MFIPRTVILFIIAIFSTATAFAQERTLSNNAPGILRSWQRTGNWQVILTRNIKGKLVCILGTAKVSSSKDVSYIYGLIEKDNSTRLVIIDSDQSALSGSSISVRIDGVSIGAYPVTYRYQNPHGPQSVIESILSKKEAYRVEQLFSYGSHLEFRTKGATYSAPLTGAGQGIYNFHNCINEVSALNGNQK